MHNKKYFKFDRIVVERLNPFEYMVTQNFFHDSEDVNTPVDAIHWEQRQVLEDLFHWNVLQGKQVKTVLLTGESGSGKSYFLKQIKSKLEESATFIYIEPWSTGTDFYRHVLRYMIDSMKEFPPGKTQSQLSLWLLKLIRLWTNEWSDRHNPPGSKKRVELPKGDGARMQAFINDMQDRFPSGIFQPHYFFKVFYQLKDPDKYHAACSWLRGDLVPGGDTLLGCDGLPTIETESHARQVIFTLGRLAAMSQPIVLCFDNLDNIPQREDGKPDIQPLINLNTGIHQAGNLHFFVIISAKTRTWSLVKSTISGADLRRVSDHIYLGKVENRPLLDLVKMRLADLHADTNHEKNDPLFPVTVEGFENNFPSGVARPREALAFAKDRYKEYRNGLIGPGPCLVPPDPMIAFRYAWNQSRNKIESSKPGVETWSSTQMISFLKEALVSFGVPFVDGPKISKRKIEKYKHHFFMVRMPYLENKAGPIHDTVIVWCDEQNLNTFSAVLFRFLPSIAVKPFERVIFFRSTHVGEAGQKVWGRKEQFLSMNNRMINPTIEERTLLATHHALVNKVKEEEFSLIGDEPVTMDMFASLVRESGLFEFPHGIVIPGDEPAIEVDPVEQHMMDLVASQNMVATTEVLKSTCAIFSKRSKNEVKQSLDRLIACGKVKSVDKHKSLLTVP